MSEELVREIAGCYFVEAWHTRCQLHEIADLGDFIRVTFTAFDPEHRDKIFTSGCRVVIDKQSMLLYSPRPRSQRSDIDDFPKTRELMGVFDYRQSRNASV